MSPESLTERRYSAATDAYSFGVLLWEIASDGELPYSDLTTFAEVITAVVSKGMRPTIPHDCPKPLVDLMAALWATTPESRPCMSEVSKTLRRLADPDAATTVGSFSERNFDGTQSDRSASSRAPSFNQMGMASEDDGFSDTESSGSEYVGSSVVEAMGRGYDIIALKN